MEEGAPKPYKPSQEDIQTGALLDDLSRNASKEDIKKFRDENRGRYEYSGELGGHQIKISYDHGEPVFGNFRRPTETINNHWTYSIDGQETIIDNILTDNSPVAKRWRELFDLK